MLLGAIVSTVTAGAVSSFISGVTATVTIFTVCKKTAGKGEK